MVWQVEIQGSGGSPSTVDNPVPGVAPSPGAGSVSGILAGAGGPAPQGSSSGGSIGGSLVGKDPAADQWVRDLIQQELQNVTFQNQILSLAPSTGLKLLGGLEASKTYTAISPLSSTDNPWDSTNTATVKLLGNPILVIAHANVGIEMNGGTFDGLNFWAGVQFDHDFSPNEWPNGVWTVQSLTASAGGSDLLSGSQDISVNVMGVLWSGVSSQWVTDDSGVADITSLLAAGNHTFHMSYLMSASSVTAPGGNNALIAVDSESIAIFDLGNQSKITLLN